MARERDGSDASTVPMEHENKENKEPNAIEITPTRDTLPIEHVEHSHGRIDLDVINGYEYTAYNFSIKKKWWILTVVALCQTSMNFVGINCVGPTSTCLSCHRMQRYTQTR